MAIVSPAARPAPPLQQFMPELLLVHAEELEFLWARRRATLMSDAFTVAHLNQLNERIEAHTQGLLVAREALTELAAPRLAAGERDAVFAGAYPLLRSSVVADARQVIVAFGAAAGPTLDGLRDALALANIDAVEAPLRGFLDGADAPRAAAAALVLAGHRRLDPASPRIGALLRDADPEVARVGWWIAAALDETRAVELPYAPALQADNERLLGAALEAAIWRGEGWAPELALRLAHQGVTVAQLWVAATAGPEALDLLRTINAKGRRTPWSLRLAGRYGHPQLIALLVEAMGEADAQLAAAAGEAFTRISGIAVDGRREAVAVAEDADDYAREFALAVWRPSASEARRIWAGRREAWDSGLRWCRGFEVSHRLAVDARQRIDLQALWDFGARAALAGRRVFAPPALA